MEQNFIEQINATVDELESLPLQPILPIGLWPILRLDGHGFSELTKHEFVKPFDKSFSEMMKKTAESLFTQFGGVVATTHSDEISIVLPFNTDIHGRKMAKLLSISAGLVSSVFSTELGSPAHFDSRVFGARTADEIAAYVLQRQISCTRNALNDYAYWTVKKLNAVKPTGYSAHLKNVKSHEKKEILRSFGPEFDFENVPNWWKYGTVITSVAYTKTVDANTVVRRKIVINDDPPKGPELYDEVKRIILEKEKAINERASKTSK